VHREMRMQRPPLPEGQAWALLSAPFLAGARELLSEPRSGRQQAQASKP